MGFLTKLIDKIIEMLNICKGLFSGILTKLSGLKKPGMAETSRFQGIKSNIIAGISGLQEKFGNRMLLLIGLGGLTLILLVLLISVARPGTRERRASDAPPAMTAGFILSVEDLFLPLEPEFTPEFLLEQEPRSTWSIEDIRSHWRTPSDLDIWRNEIRSAVDRIMEGVR